MNTIEEIKKELISRCEGKTLVRKDRSYKGKEANGIITYNVFFDYPAPKEKQLIFDILKKYPINVVSEKAIVVGGLYGYKILFEIMLV